MLLQGSRSAQRPIQVVPTHPEQAPAGPEPTTEPVAYEPRRSYAPISWEQPSLGKSVATGLGGIARTTLLFLLAGAVFVGAAMAIAIVVTSVVFGLGFDAGTGY
ncbi:hypothetical protein BJ973_002665 [Actinoplanes tereljensis]|uniref:Uncharacterized protein n=1 Tax=Paractinoplanes tereljensis TaxID=571912 RepID=A0A919TU28_9ACTN|nr:hypothetical protein [Actinoplanes tereljensis]GIF22341.1 hypothetical protein Ate02nite_50710 [Actinoplanes tereljensis]